MRFVLIIIYLTSLIVRYQGFVYAQQKYSNVDKFLPR